MNIHLNAADRARISCYQGNNFIDVKCLEHEPGLAIEAHPRKHYIEIRQKAGAIMMFFFRSKRAKKDMDLGWWADAEVIWARNEVEHG